MRTTSPSTIIRGISRFSIYIMWFKGKQTSIKFCRPLSMGITAQHIAKQRIVASDFFGLALTFYATAIPPGIPPFNGILKVLFGLNAFARLLHLSLPLCYRTLHICQHNIQGILAKRLLGSIAPSLIIYLLIYTLISTLKSKLRSRQFSTKYQAA